MWCLLSVHTGIQIILLFILILLSSFFSSSETALTTVNRVKMRNLADSGNVKAKKVLEILDHQDKMLSCILIGNNIVNLSASSLSTTLAIRLFGSQSIGIATGILTLLILIFGEITPKNAANVNSEKISLRSGPVIRTLMFILTPLIVVVSFLSSGAMKLLHVKKDGGDSTITEDEIRTMVDVSHEEGETTGEERALINNVYDLTDQTAADIMVPRADMVSISADDNYEHVMEVFQREHFTRLPVYEGERDHIIGIINVKDFCFLSDPKKRDFSPRKIMYQPYFTFESKSVVSLMEEMQSRSYSLAIVLDEYGAAAGMITFEDLIEELVGEIRDEYDTDEKDWIKKVGPGTYLILGSVKLDDLNEELGTGLESEDYDSIGGYLIHQLGDRIPRTGDRVRTESGIMLSVQSMKKRRIERVRLVLPEKAAPEPDKDSGQG